MGGFCSTTRFAQVYACNAALCQDQEHAGQKINRAQSGTHPKYLGGHPGFLLADYESRCFVDAPSRMMHFLYDARFSQVCGAINSLINKASFLHES